VRIRIVDAAEMELGSRLARLLPPGSAPPSLRAAVVLAVAAPLAGRAATFQHTHWADLRPALVKLNALAPAPGSVLVTHYEIPAVRYFYELGPFRGDARYPGVFRFERTPEAAQRSPIDARQECLEYAISPAPLDALAARLPGSRLTRVPGPAPAYLLDIDPGTPRPAHCPARPDPPTPAR
jgi:hypothetical protein